MKQYENTESNQNLRITVILCEHKFLFMNQSYLMLQMLFMHQLIATAGHLKCEVTELLR